MKASRVEVEKLHGLIESRVTPLVNDISRAVTASIVEAIVEFIGSGTAPKRKDYQRAYARAYAARRKLDKGLTLTAAEEAAITLPTRRRDMRCRYVDRSRHRCKNRSRGPRFHYLCVKHKDTGSPEPKPKPDPEQEWLSVAAAADLANTHVNYLRQVSQRGKIRRKEQNGTFVYSRRDVIAWAEKRSGPKDPKAKWRQKGAA